MSDERATWRFDEGEPVWPGRHAVRLLGGGRRYEAYLVWDDALHALAVAKLVRPSLVTNARALEGLALEARALNGLAHPAIVRAFDAVLQGERPHVLLEYLDGPRLSTLLSGYGLALEQVLPLALQVCGALHYMAGRGFVHLDVKPRNVIMGGPPRLIDLSVARTVPEARVTTGFVGTDVYMAPEQCVPERFEEIGPATDVWGLGVTLYEAIARTRPFPPGERGAPDGPERFPQLAVEPQPLPPSVPPAVAGAVLSCLSPDPGARPSAAALAAELEPLVAALPPPRLGRFRPAWREHARRLR